MNYARGLMKSIVHVANTDVESEYAHPSINPIEHRWNKHPLCLQLQFLPLLYAEPSDLIAVTALPSHDYLDDLLQTGWWPLGLPKIVPLKEQEPYMGAHCIPWGSSRQVQSWARARGISYDLPTDWQTICLINSKSFSFRYTCLPEAALLFNLKELKTW